MIVAVIFVDLFALLAIRAHCSICSACSAFVHIQQHKRTIRTSQFRSTSFLMINNPLSVGPYRIYCQIFAGRRVLSTKTKPTAQLVEMKLSNDARAVCICKLVATNQESRLFFLTRSFNFLTSRRLMQEPSIFVYPCWSDTCSRVLACCTNESI
jgi:hypothetical protein